MKKFKYTLLVALGFLIFTTTQFATSSDNGQQDQVKKYPGASPTQQPADQQDDSAQAQVPYPWGSGTAAAAPDIDIDGMIPLGGSCGATTLRFNEVPFQPVNGLTVRGAQFRFTIAGKPSTDAHYNAPGPGMGVFVQDPVLEGNANGTLQIDFPALTPFLSFGLARSTFSPLTPGATVLLFDMNFNLIGSFPVNTAIQPGGMFSEGQFTYNNSAAPVRRAIILFPSANVATRFALDNLSYRAYDISLEDDATHDIFQFNSITGDYQFLHCANSFSVFGRGGAVKFGCNLNFGAGGGNKGGSAQVQAAINTCTNSGNATIMILPSGPTYTVSDSNTTNNTCTCGVGGQS